MMTVMVTLAGRWRIIDTAAWPREHLELCGPAFLRIDPEGSCEMAFGALNAAISAGFTASGIDFEWNGSDEARLPATMATKQPSLPNRGLFPVAC